VLLVGPLEVPLVVRYKEVPWAVLLGRLLTIVENVLIEHRP
jgi:hypothetical protein